MKLEHINVGSIWMMLTGTVLAVVYMFTTFVTAAEFNQFSVEVYYGQYYERLEDWQRAIDSGNDDYANELERQLERLRAKICEEDPEWERCDDE